MIFDNIEANEQELASLSEDFGKIMTFGEHIKGTMLHKEDTVCNHLFIIQKGLARAFYYKDGQDITAHFALEGTSITAIDSLIQRKRSRYNIEVLEDSSIISISKEDMDALLKEKPQYEKHIRLYMEQIYIDLAERVEDLVFHSAKERYDKILEKTPQLIQRVNLKHIASYLGITQETLSRIRAMD